MYFCVFVLLIFTLTYYILNCENTAVIEKQRHLQNFKAFHLSKNKKSITITPASSIVETTTKCSLHETSHHPIASSPTKVILFYTDFYGYPYWQMGKKTHTEIDLKNLKCPVTSCILTHDRKFLNRADFVMFHIRDKVDIPKTRNINQSFVMFTIESPAHIGGTYKNYSGMFNLTMTYRLDSDIHMRYGIVKNKLTGEQVAPNFKPLWNKVDADMSFVTSDEDTMKMIRSKNVTAAWFVSNCYIKPSRRDKLMEKLQSHGIDVDIYGNCGTKKCPFGSAACDRLLNSTYKFYCSFENSLYADYVTEKVFNNMKNYIVPVVFNGADMNRFLPPKSYVNAQDFKTAEELAAHLKFLAKNETEYIKYFWWRKYYDIESQPYIPICDLFCAKAHQSIHKTYKNVFEWYNNGQFRESKIAF